MHSVFYGTCPAYLTNIVEPPQVVGKLSVNYCRTNTRKAFLANVFKSLEQFTTNYSELFFIGNIP